ncbi:AAA family ATPase [Oscillatoria sp. FACHB-1406]|uniref:AAA family ATPase n=1 Tax=Oscillatoria sp. FACHB-1406 TaxID=2692846 RepID=UPI0016827D54|nr:AAA family ATPase [Oscillatoria sp. FACHB-1406]
MIIESVNIEGFWGNKKVVAKFNQDVSIFIGLNGTGKSTFVNLIAATLSLDLIQLNSLQFDSIIIKLIDRKTKRRRTITLTKQRSDDNLGFNIYEYKLGNRLYRLAEPRIFKRSRVEQYQRLPPYAREEQFKLKRELSNLVEVSQLSVYRQTYDESLEYDPRQRISAVDERLRQLFEKFSRYQLKIETRLNEISKKFQQDAVSSLLYNEKFDKFNSRFNKLNEINLEDLKDKLYLAFQELGIQDKNQELENHLKKIEEAREGLKTALQADDVLALPLIYRTNHIIDSLNQSEKEKNTVIEDRQNFFKTLHTFMKNKNFLYDNKTGELLFNIEREGSQKFAWTALSSGEKQLLIQFLEVLLHEQRSVIFIADEPEISLHVTWQENLLKAIRKLNENAQLIIATHSPDIVADFRDKVLDMQQILN